MNFNAGLKVKHTETLHFLLHIMKEFKQTEKVFITFL